MLLLGPVGLLVAWWEGFEPHWLVSALALAPACAGALVALTRKEYKLPLLPGLARAAAELTRPAAGAAYTRVVRIEQGFVRVLAALARGLSAPLRDLHTGDAQEYLLFLVAVGVLVLLLPLLR